LDSDAPVFAFVNVDVVPMDGGGDDNRGRLVVGQTVLVQGGLITEMGPFEAVAIPENAMRIDGEGQYLMPGLTEMHGHLPNPNMPEEVTENVLFLYIANGVTTVRGMQGNASQLALRERIEAGELPGPRLILGSPSMNGEGVESPEQAEALVREYHEAGFDLLKVHEGLTPEVYDAIANTARELGIPFAGHVSDHVGLFHALEAGQTTIDHLDNLVEALVPEERKPDEPAGLRGVDELLDAVDESRLPSVIQALLDADVSVVPTMVLWESGIFATRPSADLLEERTEIQYMPSEMVAAWTSAVDDRVAETEPEAMRRVAELRRRVLKALHEGGVRILLGTDSPQIFSVPGFSIHREMAFYQDSGMAPYEALASGTSVVGDYFGEDFGRVAPGQRADLILLTANPLEDVANVARRSAVMVNGTFWSEEDIATRLDAIADSYQ
jgi:imidazolonepropionase-like amidohydrolase